MSDLNVVIGSGPVIGLAFDGANAGAAAGYATAAAASATAAEAAESAAASITNTFISTSATSLAIGSGSKTLTVATGKQFQIGQFVTITSSADVTKWMFGQVTGYITGSGSLVVSVSQTNGTGTFASWNVSVAGVPGSGTNATTLNGKADTAFVQVANNLSDITPGVARNNLGLGTAAVANTGTSGANVPLLNASSLTWANSPTFASGLTSTGDITVNRSGSPTTGALFFGNTGVHYLYFDGTNFAVGGTGTFIAPSGGFSGTLTGNVTGNASGSSGSCTGNAASATTAATVSNGAITPTKLSAGGPSWDSAGNLIIGGTLFTLTGLSNVRFGDTGGGFITVQFNSGTYIQWSPSGYLNVYNNSTACMSMDGSGNMILAGTLTQNGSP